MPPPPHDVQLLLSHAHWVRALARRLVNNQNDADDLEQELWVRAIQQKPNVSISLRGWIATILRNLKLEHNRGDGRRTDREQRAARNESVPPNSELVERAMLHRELVEQVLQLEEPYRSVILARYFEGLPPSEIARLHQIPVETVKTRLKRATEKLRAQLDAKSNGDRGAWMAAFLPLTHDIFIQNTITSLSIKSSLWAAIIMNIKLIVAIGAAGALGLFWYLTRTPEVSTHEPARTEQTRETKNPPPSEKSNITEAARTRSEAPAPSEPVKLASKPAAPENAKEVRVAGRVIGVRSENVAGVEIRGGNLDQWSALEPAGYGNILAKSDDAGKFEFVISDKKNYPSYLFGCAPHLCCIMAGTPLNAENGRESLVVVAPKIELAGRVLNEEGKPVENAIIEIVLPAALRTKLIGNVESTTLRKLAAASDAEGYYKFTEAAAVEGAMLHAAANGYVSIALVSPSATSVNFNLTLKRPGESANWLRGKVVDSADNPVAGAFVGFGIDTIKTNSEGGFEFDIATKESYNEFARTMMNQPAFAPSELVAVKAGFLPATYSIPKENGVLNTTETIVLKLSGTALSISGHVVTDDGKPVVDTPVWLANPTFFGGIGAFDRKRGPKLTHIESVMAGADSGGAAWRSVSSDSNGEFTINGVCDREYQIEALDSETLQRGIVENVRGGSRGVTITIARKEVFPSLKGIVVSHSGKKLAGVRVFPMCDTFKVKFEQRVIGTSHQSLEGVTTNADGEFEIKNVPKNLVYLRFQSQKVVPLEWGRDVEGGLEKLVGKDFDKLRIEVDQRCSFQVELIHPDEGDELAMFKADGGRVSIDEYAGRSRNSGKHKIIDGRSAQLSAADNATTLVIYKNGTEVRRKAITLNPEEITTLKL
ncbi:MAG: sigma-70 family RNA polymerase sigma factor [Planctomycetota bacterium]